MACLGLLVVSLLRRDDLAADVVNRVRWDDSLDDRITILLDACNNLGCVHAGRCHLY